MMVISFWVMLAKGVILSRTDSANKAFQNGFANVGSDILSLQVGVREARHSSLGRLYVAAAAELRKRVEGPNAKQVLSAQSIDAIRATLDAGVIRENAKLNSQMVLLTIAISGGPFLGLLGTVVGVMITFAAIAAAGDVNVNSIAPGIAAALVATVAGLAVAIPALFGYNYLAAQVKNISADMAVFVDEIVSRIAEKYAP
jgi:biopolymer transport protein ExbB